MVNLKIDDKKVCVPEGTTILDAAKQAGIDIPTLCFLKDINEVGDCRMCIVEVEGRRGFATSCIQKVEEGMVVHTHTPNVLEARHTILDLIISIVVSFFSIIFSFMYSHIYLQFLVSWVIPIVNGFIFYPLYRMHIKNTLNKNVNQNFSPIQVAQKKGGVNSGAVGIAIGVMFFIYIMLFIFLVSMALVIYNIFEGGRYIYNNFDKDEIYQYFDSYIDRQKPKGLEDYDFDI